MKPAQPMFFSRLGAFLLALILTAAARPAGGAPAPGEIRVLDGEVQRALDAVTTHGLVLCERNRPLTLTAPLAIRKPLTLTGLNARLPAGLSKTPLVCVEAEGVAITDCELTGNADSVDQNERNALIEVRAGGFRFERLLLVNSSKDGIMIDGPGAGDRDIVGGVIRDIVGRGCVRDVVSIGGGGVNGHRIRNLLVDNVRGYDSELRGVVEVSDGTDNITVRKVYAEKCVYAIDVQDHGKPREINTNVVLQDIYAVDCKHAVRTANHAHGHASLTLRDVTAVRCEAPLRLLNTDGLTLEGVRVLEHKSNQPLVELGNCQGVTVRDVLVRDCAGAGPAVLFQDCGQVTMDGLTLQGETGALAGGVCYRIKGERAYSGLIVRGVMAPGLKEGIVLEKGKGKASPTLSDVLIAGNLSRVVDGIRGQRTRIEGNMEKTGAQE